MFFSILVPPEFVKTLSNQAIIEKSQTTLEVEVTGEPQPSIKWYKDDIELVSNKKIQIAGSSLTIISTDLEDAGTYKAVAENQAGSTSSSASLDVSNAPVFVGELLPATGTAIENKAYSLEVQAQGVPEPEVVFFKNGNQIQDNESYSIQKLEKSHKLSIKSVAEDDRGLYKVKASNTAGHVEAECNLDVVTLPEIIRGLEDQTVKLHEDMQLSIEIRGMASISWTINDKDANEFKNIELKSDGQIHTLFISKVEVAQEGIYKVTTSNDAGSYTSTANIFVQGMPSNDV